MPVDNSGNTIATPAGNIVINPGSGPVADATLDYAQSNMQRLILDAGVPQATILRHPGDDDRGRFGFLVWQRGEEYAIRACTVQMPGIPIREVRYMQEPGQDIWDFPRLYVDDSSWVWCFAVNCVRRALTGQEED